MKNIKLAALFLTSLMLASCGSSGARNSNHNNVEISTPNTSITHSSNNNGNNNFEDINRYKNTKGFVVARIKKKKWKSIQLKFYSTKHFGLYSSTLESYVGSYVKR